MIGDVINAQEFVNRNNITYGSIALKSDVIAKYIVNKSKEKRGLVSSELSGGNSSGLIHLNELLPPEVFNLFMKARQEKKKGLSKSVWHDFGHIYNIYVNKSKKSRIVQIIRRRF